MDSQNVELQQQEENQIDLNALCDYVSASTYEWLEEAEEKEKGWRKIQNSFQKFQKQAATQSEDQASTGSAAQVQPPRVLRWTSSTTHPDGYGGIEHDNVDLMVQPTGVDCLLEDTTQDPVTVKYILSDNWQGFGNQVWPASRHLANMLADPELCRTLLPRDRMEPKLVSFSNQQQQQHPLQDLYVCELGTGAGIPSWTAMTRGARVIALDEAIPGRIRVIAECAHRNWRELLLGGGGGRDDQHDRIEENNEKNSVVHHKPMVHPYDWGSPVDDIIQLINDKDKTTPQLFDVVLVADCCFMPWFHVELLDSIHMLLSDQGVALLTFALHGNVPEEQVWGIIDLAEERGFVVEQPVNPKQLTPQRGDMQPRQALVYTLRLSKRMN